MLKELHEYSDALSDFRKIYESFPLNKHIERKITTIRSKIDECMLK